VVTSTPSNEAELQLYRVLQRASLLIYYDTLLEMGGDDVQQLCDAGEEEFLEIMALVGMASKPLHVRRLQKALQDLSDTPLKHPRPSQSNVQSRTCPRLIQITLWFPQSISSIYPNSAISSSSTSSLIAPNTGGGNLSLSSIASGLGGQIGTLSSTSSSAGGMGAGVQLTPSLTEPQIHRITQAAERISQRPQMAQLAPRSQSSKKRSSKELEAVMGMNESDPRRMDEIRKYSAIYGRFDCKRRPEKPLTLHEVCVNEAAAQICRFVPALLTRRDELFTLARQVVRASGFGHSAGIARFAMSQHMPRDEDLDAPATTKKARLSSGGGSDGNLDASKVTMSHGSGIIQGHHRMPHYHNNGGDMDSEPLNVSNDNNKHDDSKEQPSSPDSHSDGPIGIQIISASGGHIIAVANPALALSPALGDTMSVKRERGDDVQQLCDAGEEEFLEIMALVGMASKPLHVRRLQKALQEWVTNPSAFQTPLSNTPDLPRAMYSPEHAQGSSRSPFGSSIHSSIYPTSAISSSSTSSLIAPNTGGGNLSLSSIASGLGGQIGTLSSTSSSTGGMGAGVQLTPSLTEPQIHRITQAAERISQRPQMAQLAPRSQSSKKRSSKELEAVMGMNESDPRRMDEIRKYSAIYGRFDCKRRPEKPLTLHEVCVNEAAAQICRFVPALLTRRDELFTLARQVVRASGFGHSAGIARFAMSQHMPRDEDLDAPATTKKARLSSGGGSDGNLDASKVTMSHGSGIIQGHHRNFGEQGEDPLDVSTNGKIFRFSRFGKVFGSNNGGDMDSEPLNVSNDNNKHDDSKEQPSSPDSHSDGPIGIQIISASGGHIIAVANPALALSPALGDTMSQLTLARILAPL
uniref:Putative transcriptional corepressor nab1 n=1 Tax=Lutzomyia longipalpis TaxID=7200 RepID=A0A1B0CAP4_LUTLO